MLLGIFGPRDYRGSIYEDSQNIYRWMDSIVDSFGTIEKIVSGGSKGVEHYAGLWAAKHNIPLQIVPPNLKLHGYSNAFSMRNNEIIDMTDQTVVFWDGESKYITVSVLYAAQHCKPMLILPMGNIPNSVAAQTSKGDA